MVRELTGFIEKHGLDREAGSELVELFSTASKKMKVEAGSTAPRYRWDQIHEMIKTHSPNTSLVIVNLPDPPDIEEGMSEDDALHEMTEFMNYLEGVAESLPRVLYVHGSGQEVINLDALGQ